MLDGESLSWAELTSLDERQSLNDQNDLCTGRWVGETHLTRHVISCWFVGTGHESSQSWISVWTNCWHSCAV